jgi:hypothetical protein
MSCDEIITCWCGAVGTFDELFDVSGLPKSSDQCGGTGCIQCECGGDQCVCHHHGEIACEGCEGCEDPADYAW